MGIIQPYFPKEIVLKLANIANAEIFVETGTYYGNTSEWASSEFKNIFTIELSEYLYNITKEKLLLKRNINHILANSKNVLPNILKTIDSNVVFWLDGHYSGGVTAGEDDPCPLREELGIILKRYNDDIIIIDDARDCIGGTFPSIQEIYRLINKTAKNKRFLQICNDHIYIIPDKKEYVELLLEYVLEQNILLWKAFVEYNRENVPLKNKIYGVMSKFCQIIKQK